MPLPPSWGIGNNINGNRRRASVASVVGGEFGQRSNSRNGAGAVQQPDAPSSHVAEQGGVDDDDIDDDGVVDDDEVQAEALAQRCCEQWLAELKSPLDAFWRELARAERQRLLDELYENVRDDVLRREFSVDEIFNFWADRADAALEQTFRSVSARSRLTAAEASTLPMLPTEWLEAAKARAATYRVADVDLRRSVTELSEAQRAIVNDKALKEAYAPFNMAHLLRREADRARDKDLRVASEAANRAAFYVALLQSALDNPALVERWLLDKAVDAFMTDLARLSQGASRERAKLAVEKNAFERLTAPEEHLSRLPVMGEMAEQLGLKSVEQMFSADRSARKRAREATRSGHNADAVGDSAWSCGQCAIAWRPRRVSRRGAAEWP